MDDCLGGFGMSRCMFPIAVILLTLLVLFGCADDDTGEILNAPVPKSIAELSGHSGIKRSTNHTYVMSVFEIYVNVEDETLEVIADLTAEYTLNVIPFLYQAHRELLRVSMNQLSYDGTDPDMLQLDLEFQYQYPYPDLNQYGFYDLMGVILTEGEDYGNPQGLKRGKRGVDVFMTNADGYTRWGNALEFTTELTWGRRFQYNPAQLNPYKYYAKGLGPDDNLWDFLDSGSNNDGQFQPGDGRTMSLEVPITEGNRWPFFRYATVCSWDDHNLDGPYTPYHRKEAIACSVSVTDDIYYTSESDYGGNLILDFSLWAWEEQPSVVMVESTVLSSAVLVTDPPCAGGDHFFTYHLNVPVDSELTSTEDHEFWIIAESSGYDYLLPQSHPLPRGIPAPEGPLAAYFRYPLHVADEPYNENKIP